MISSGLAAGRAAFSRSVAIRKSRGWEFGYLGAEYRGPKKIGSLSRGTATSINWSQVITGLVSHSRMRLV